MKTINSFRSKLAVFMIALVASISTFAYDFQDGYLFYNILEDGTAAVTSEKYGFPYDYLPTALIIPDRVTDYNGKTYIVTEIANYAFGGCDMLESLVIPNTVKKIGMYAFTACTKLVDISFPDSLEDIMGGALYECAWYNNQPDGLIYIGNLLYRYKGTAPAGTIIVKEGTTAILDFTFHNQPNIQSVILPESLTSIHLQAFYGCTNITELILPASIQIIENQAFAYCTSLTEVTCYATIPPVRGDVVSDSPSDWFFEGVDVSKIPLYVPVESIDLYKEAEQWSGFHPILSIQSSYKSQWCNKWNVMWFDGMRFDETASTSQYRLGKDTIIGDYRYSKFTSRTSVRFTSDRKVYVYYEGFDDNDPYTEDLPTGEYLAYDFSAQVGDTLEVFSGSHSYTTEQCVVYDVQTDPETNLRTIMLHPLRVVDSDGNIGVSGEEEITWLEGVGSPNGFLISTPLPGGGLFALLCAYKDDELKYTGSYYERFGCDYKAGVVSDDLFPTLSGLQRTICREYCEQADNKTRIEQFTNLTTRTETGGPYLYYSPFLLREKDNKILIYSRTLNKDLVLYDFNLQVGDSLPMLYIDFFAKDDWIADRDMEIWCVVDYHKDLEGNILPADTLIVTDVSAITLLDGKEYKKWTFNNGMEYVEGIGSFGNRQWSGDFFQLIGNMDIPVSLHGEHLVCVSKNNKLLYQMDDTEMERLGAECLCQAEQKPEDLFPTLWGLQRTVCNEYCGETEDDNSGNITYKQTFTSISFENNKPYILCRGYLLREESNKILLYSESLNKEIVLYDFTLAVGDSLPTYIEHFDETIYPADTLVVTDISSVTLLDGKKYKKWTFDNGMEYVEGIGMYGGHRNGNFVGLIQEIVVPCHTGTHLVCVSKNGKLLYQMDDAEMERLGAECLCEYNSGPKKDNAKNGKIGGRPTPTQWNMLEVETKEMDGTPTILRAETFSYTLENDSIIANNKTFYQLARQSTKDTAITKSFVGALHFGEDEDNRVYFLRDGVEYVLYDFTAEPGDTIEIFAGINNYPQETTYTHVVIGKDTLENGTCRMMLEVVFPEEIGSDLEQQHLQKVWLAGLGSIDGIVHNAAKRTSNVHAAPSRSARNGDTQTSVMLCAWREDSCLYTTDHPDYDTFGCVYNQDPTAIENLTSPSSYQKIIHEGTLLILHEGKVYNIIGIQIK